MGGDDLQGAAALRAVFHIDLEHSFTRALPGFVPSGRRSPFKTLSRRFYEQPGPAHGGRRRGSQVALAIPPGIRDVHDTCSTFIASMKRFASRIDASISRISTAMSDSIEARLPLSEAIAWALRLCLRNSTWS